MASPRTRFALPALSAAAIVVASLASAASCTAILGGDKDYHLVDGGAGGAGGAGSSTDASTGSTSTGVTSSTSGATTSASTGGGPCVCTNVPMYWTAVSVSVIDPSAPPGKCADGTSPQTLYTQPMPATCTPCQCGAVTGTICSAPQITCSFLKNDCSSVDYTTFVPLTACTDILNAPSGPNSSGSCKLTGSAQVQSKSCSTSGGQLETGPWGGLARVCGAPKDGMCASGEVCASSGGSDGPTCIRRSGQSSCPSGWPNQILAYADFTDKRQCSSCSCNIDCVGGGYVVHDSPGCMDTAGSPVPVTTNTCTPTPGLFDYASASLEPTAATPMLTGCNGGGANGQVNGKNETTICCK